MWIAAQLADGWLRVWMHEGQQTKLLTAPSCHEAATEDQLLALVGPALHAKDITRVICAGAYSAPRIAVPTPLGRAQQISSIDPRLVLFAMPTLTQVQPPDILQGQEATIAGFTAEHPEWDGVLCIAGPSTRWVHISAGEVVSFRSLMTGEMFSLLCGQSTLQSALAGAGWDADTFALSVDDAMSRPERLAAALASLRAEAVLSDVTPSTARAHLSGWLIGAELAAARPYWLGQNVALIGDGEIVQCYAAALAAQGAMMQIHSGEALTLRGLRDVYANLRGS